MQGSPTLLAVSVTCPRCTAPVRLVAFARQAVCDHCSCTIPIRRNAWLAILDHARAQSRRLAVGKGVSTVIEHQGLLFRSVVGPFSPRCASCGRHLHLDRSGLGEEQERIECVCGAEALKVPIHQLLGYFIPGFAVIPKDADGFRWRWYWVGAEGADESGTFVKALPHLIDLGTASLQAGLKPASPAVPGGEPEPLHRRLSSPPLRSAPRSAPPPTPRHAIVPKPEPTAPFPLIPRPPRAPTGDAPHARPDDREGGPVRVLPAAKVDGRPGRRDEMFPPPPVVPLRGLSRRRTAGGVEAPTVRDPKRPPRRGTDPKAPRGR